VREGDQLIACGFFDLGESSAAGITSFYDPAYKKYSLGKYLIYKKIEYCKNQGKQYFYPGYFVPGNPHFDYKLSIGHNALHFLALHTNRWVSIMEFQPDLAPVQSMQTQLQIVQQVLTAGNIQCKLFKYEFFDANLIPDLRNAGLFDFPVFLAVTEANTDRVNPVLVYDVRTAQYYTWMCAPVWKPDRINPDPSFYSSYFIKPIQELYASADAEKVAAVWMKFFKPASAKAGIVSEDRL
jgi:leucyl-tRNA---protein transferase